jgi:hypothetical protein
VLSARYRRGPTVCFAAAPGTTTPGTVGQRTATGTIRRTGTTTTVCVLFCSAERFPSTGETVWITGIQTQCLRRAQGRGPVSVMCGPNTRYGGGAGSLYGRTSRPCFSCRSRCWLLLFYLVFNVCKQTFMVTASWCECDKIVFLPATMRLGSPTASSLYSEFFFDPVFVCVACAFRDP